MTDAQYEKIIAGQASLETEVRLLSNRLFGNGQPGAIQSIHSEHEVLEGRVGSIERKQAWFTGAGTVIGATVGYLSSYLKH